MKLSIFKIIPLVTFLSLFSTPGAATIVTESYVFNASGFGSSAPQDTINGNFTFTYDTSTTQNDVALDDINLSINGFNYSLGDVAFDAFTSFSTTIFDVGGITNTNDNLSFGTDDFLLIFVLTNDVVSFSSFSYSTSDTTDVFNASTVSVSPFIVSAPEPSSLFLLLAGLPLIGTCRKHL